MHRTAQRYRSYEVPAWKRIFEWTLFSAHCLLIAHKYKCYSAEQQSQIYGNAYKLGAGIHKISSTGINRAISMTTSIVSHTVCSATSWWIVPFALFSTRCYSPQALVISMCVQRPSNSMFCGALPGWKYLYITVAVQGRSQTHRNPYSACAVGF